MSERIQALLYGVVGVVLFVIGLLLLGKSTTALALFSMVLIVAGIVGVLLFLCGMLYTKEHS